MIIILKCIICGLFLFLGYLLVKYTTKCNYHFWVSRCKDCQYFVSEDYDLYGVNCKKQGWMTVSEIEQCEYFNNIRKENRG